MGTALILLAILYLLVITNAANLFQNIPTLIPASQYTPTHNFSILIPFRNEMVNLPNIIQSLSQLTYPAVKTEIIFCSDHSPKAELEFLQSCLNDFPFPYQIVQNSPQELGKKHAITLGIKSARHPFIITTDADCIVPSEWLIVIDNTLTQTNATCVAGPVVYHSSRNNLLSYYQQTENAGLIVFTAIGIQLGFPFMANGANFCYSKETFYEVGGFDGNLAIASGDDEFLLKKIQKKFPGKIAFCKSQQAMVQTKVQETVKQLIWQRVRWASKIKFHKNKSAFVTQAVVFLFYISIVFHLLFYSFHAQYFTAVLPLLLKIVADIYFNWRILSFFKIRKSLINISLSSLLQILLVPVVGVLSFRGTFLWKDRKHSA